MATAEHSRVEALRAAYLSAKDRLPAGSTLADFEARTFGWECHPAFVGRQVVGAVFVSGPEIHACIQPAGFGRWLTRPLLRLVDRAIERYGYAMTRAATNAGRQFVVRLGFKATRIEPTIFLKVRHGH